MSGVLQWGGRFSAAPDQVLLRYGSSLGEDLVLAPFDVLCSRAHVAALRDGGMLGEEDARALLEALDAIADEVANGSFVTFAHECAAEDIHGAIDARVREMLPRTGEMLHAGRSRNDQVATTLLLYCADRAQQGKALALRIASSLAQRAEHELAQKTILPAVTHWQPAQPVLLAFWLQAAAEPFVRDAHRLLNARSAALESCPLGSAAVAGSCLPLNRTSSCAALGFQAPSRNAMDAVGNRDAALDVAHAFVRAVLSASRLCEELIIWCTPGYGFAQLDDAASTGSSLMPQKRNPDPFELVRAASADLCGRYAGALGTMSGLALSYHRDLQATKTIVIGIIEDGLRALDAFSRALDHVHFDRAVMSGRANEEYTVATDVADQLILGGMTARDAHSEVGRQIVAWERDCEPLDWPDVRESLELKITPGSTHPAMVRTALDELNAVIASLQS